MTQDVYQVITDKIIAQLEAGTLPWVRPWSAESGPSLVPFNAVTGRPYRGVNVLLLTPPAEGNAWLTFKQAKDVGASVRKGEKGHMVVFFKPWAIRDVNKEGESVERSVPIIRNFTLFHTSQIDNLPEKYLPKPVEPLPEVERVARAEKMLSLAKVVHGGNRAVYSPTHDLIQMPEAATFNSMADYYATGLHELTHWSGHAKRCARDFSGRFGDAAYAFEELVAEIGSAFLMDFAQVQGTVQHASYVESWLRVLKSDKKAIVTAASAAQKACDFILTAGADSAQGAQDEEEGELLMAA